MVDLITTASIYTPQAATKDKRQPTAAAALMPQELREQERGREACFFVPVCSDTSQVQPHSAHGPLPYWLWSCRGALV